MDVTVNRFIPGDEAELLARGLRPADLAESWKTSGMPAVRAVPLSVRHSVCAGTIRINGRAASVFGIGEHGRLGHTGIPWLVAHADFENPAVAVPMARIMRKFLDHWLTVYSRLENTADPDHESALRVLRWAGFSMKTVPRHGPLGHNLVHFWKDADPAASPETTRSYQCA